MAFFYPVFFLVSIIFTIFAPNYNYTNHNNNHNEYETNHYNNILADSLDVGRGLGLGEDLVNELEGVGLELVGGDAHAETELGVVLEEGRDCSSGCS